MKTNYAYVDGSFNPDARVYGGGGFIVDQNEKITYFKVHEMHPGMASMRNVAGEIIAVLKCLHIAFYELHMRDITIYHDYDGIAKWVTGEWKTKNKFTKRYVQQVKNFMSSGMKIAFEHVKGHSGDPDNEIADRMAKEAVGIFK